MTPRPAPKLLLIAWDAAEWSLIAPLLDAGEMPNLARLLEQGALAKLSSISPSISASLWTTAVTGLRPEQHGVLGDMEPTLDRHGLQHVSGAANRAPALWQLADAAGLRALSVGWPATQPAVPLTHGVVVTNAWARPPEASRDGPWELREDSVWPARLHDDLRELRVHPRDFARSDLRRFVPDIVQVNEHAEPIVLAISQHLAAAASVHCAATFLLENEPWDFAAIYFAAPGKISRRFLDLTPPRLPQVSEAVFERYHRVVRETLKLHDEMLGALIMRAGPDAAVLLCSSSGWVTGARRPVLAAGEHAENVGLQRPAGWAVLRAAGAKADELLYGGSVLDLAPTAAWLLGLPVPAEWTGREWTHAFAQPPPLTRAAGRPASPPLPAGKIALPEMPASASDVARNLAVEWRYNLARFLNSAGRRTEAVKLFEEVRVAWPDRAGPLLNLIPALAGLGRVAEARALLEELAARPEGGLRPRDGQSAKFPPQFDFMRGVLDLAEQKFEPALVHFEAALRVDAAVSPELHANLGRVYLALRRTENARTAFARALETDADSVAAHYGMAVACYRARDFGPAASHAMEAATRRTEPFEFHLLLGLALGRRGDRREAITALHHALARRPGLLLAHRALLALHRQEPAEAFAAETHRQAVRQIFKTRHSRS